jgi:hypothetical protein
MSFHLPGKPRVLWAQLVLTVAVWGFSLVSVAALQVEAVGQDSQGVPIKQSSFRSSLSTSVIVVGFVGAFVRRDDPHHPEMRLIRELHEQYPTGPYFGLFENRDVDEAYRSIVREWNFDEGDRVSSRSAGDARIILFGHSWGLRLWSAWQGGSIAPESQSR